MMRGPSRIVAAGALLLGTAGPTAAATYRWVDDDGVIHLTNIHARFEAHRQRGNPDQAGPVDWVLVATKAYDAAGAAAWLTGLAAGGAPVAILQNGVEHRERFAAYLPATQLGPVMVDCPAERSSPTPVSFSTS